MNWIVKVGCECRNDIFCLNPSWYIYYNPLDIELGSL